MAKKSQVEILVHTPFMFNAPGGGVTEFKAGRIAVDKDVAEHWFVKAHSDQTGAVTVSGTDEELLAEIESLKTQITEKDKEIAELKAAAKGESSDVTEPQPAVSK
ncbi:MULTISPECIES: hypothetical protein [unclassified Tatumella]|uniref:STY1053 family phage-associated protein n=1 Tax=unclassified Tatumella TaxID=2649542 RepID=UPI001BAE6FF4|nr:MULTISPECIES: hypothetical protein [unclassified Tatumella]MBS0877986.1 hypothetical protein [Tatumella sp. JGM82]MBS0891291.1 hypothetical protein [Tatumella sp. JGM94]MBS0902670.1 hypothetical protein [Tatumella sp. JGM100]